MRDAPERVNVLLGCGSRGYVHDDVGAVRVTGLGLVVAVADPGALACGAGFLAVPGFGVVRREPGAGFKVLPRRWVAERTFGWFMLHRRLVRDYETRQESSRTMIHWSIISVMSRALTRTSTPTWQDSTGKAT